MSGVVFATASYDHTIKFWEPPSGACYRTIQYQDSHINRLEITPDKRLLAAAGNPHVRTFDVLVPSNNTPVTSFDGHKGNVTGLGFQQEARWMFTASEDSTVKIWDMRNPGCQRDYDLGAPINSAALHPNQAEIICGDQNGCLSVIDLTGNKKSLVLEVSASAVRSVSVSANGRYMVAVDGRGFCTIWALDSDDTSNTRKLGRFQAHDAYITRCLISPDSKVLATASSDQTIKLWDLSSTKSILNLVSTPVPLITLQGHQRWVWDMAFSADGVYLISGSSDHTARLWDSQTGDALRHYSGHHKAVVAVALNDLSLAK